MGASFLKNFLGTSQIISKLQNVSKINEVSQGQLKDALALYLLDPSEADQAMDQLTAKLNESRHAEDGSIREVVTDFVPDDKIDEAVIHLSSILGTDDQALMIFEFTEAAHYQMNKRRKSLIAPIEQARQETISLLSESYAELIRGQSTITGRLEASARISEQQDNLLKSLGLSKATSNIQRKLSNITTEIDDALQVVNALASKSLAEGSDNLPETILRKLEEGLKNINKSN